ncbi:hypothetical protein [Citricoccus sp.]|uniref:hypothetical protein n=1 Tax=Citricoccus sp. TaxID=1978372 RepID=UPI0026070C18|nr:hypothetical protein [Citricoccus sp.]HRO31457.1 hypothetical protein [Citricoccus sp.]HRO93438.1 hypothetical protein [Citricoccus sp.]
MELRRGGAGRGDPGRALLIRPSRRALLAGLTGTGTAAFLTACTSSDGTPGGTGAPASSPAPTRTASPAPAPTTAPELPGGGTRLFPGRRMVALYGTPGTGALGMLGEQDVDEAIARAAELAAEYQEHSREPVIPAFEIISTVATAAPGPTGHYSTPVDPDRLRAWVEAAGEADTYVVLDLQPGTADFLSQARMFEDLLARPHVGLALDPEWRLRPGQRHMRQVGQVSAAEVNEVTAWLAGLVTAHRLPEKLVILHQFQVRMIPDRRDVESRDGLVLMVHADGHGTPDQKQETWRALKQDLPAGMRLGWKNFVDEDHPTFTPEQTMTMVTPQPWFVSYQ